MNKYDDNQVKNRAMRQTEITPPVSQTVHFNNDNEFIANNEINYNRFDSREDSSVQPKEGLRYENKSSHGEMANDGEFLFKNTNLYTSEGYLFKSRICNEYERISEYYPSRRKLQSYQKIPANYFQTSSKFRSLLVYLGTGLGKTIIALSIMNNLKLIHNKLNIVIMCPAALKNATWRPSIDSWIEDKRLKNNIQYVSIDSPNLVTEFDVAVKSLSINSQLLFIIDECHIFTSSLVDETTNRRTVYNQLINTIRSHNAYTVCLTATPVVNRVEELIYLFNLLRADTFHSKEEIFIEMFTNSLNGLLKNKHVFCKRISGIVSYFESARKKDLPDTKEIIVRMPMTSTQLETYLYAEREESKKRAGGYKQATIAMCNFAPPLRLYKNGAYNMRSLIHDAKPEELREMSPKFADIISRIDSSKRTNVVHSSYIESTIVPFEMYLERIGYSKWSKNKVQSKSNVFATVIGATSERERADILDAFNSPENMYGKIIRVLIISDAFSMGVTLKYAENIFLLNYHWNLMKKFQAFGRIARLTTHTQLPENERFVNQIIYVSTRSSPDTIGGITVDELLEKTANQKDEKINMFLNMIKISAIDFEFNKSNPEFAWRDKEPFKASLHELKLNRPFMTRSIMDEEGIFKNNVLDLFVQKINTRQINVAYVDDKNRKRTRRALLVYPIFNYYILDPIYYNYIGHLVTNEQRPIFDKDTNYFIANIHI